MKIKVIVPINCNKFNEKIKASLDPFRAKDTDIDVENINNGTVCIESRYARAVNTPYIMDVAKKAANDSYDGVFVTCMDDPGIESIRELIDIPVIGAFQASVFTAILLSEKFSIITVEDNVIPLMREHVREQGITTSLASIKVLDISVPDLGNDSKRDEIIQKIVENSREAIDNDGAESIVLGCTGMIGIANEVAKRLLNYYGKSIPVIDPNGASIGYLELLIRNKLSHSKITFPKPPDEEQQKKKFAIEAQES